MEINRKLTGILNFFWINERRSRILYSFHAKTGSLSQWGVVNEEAILVSTKASMNSFEPLNKLVASILETTSNYHLVVGRT